MFALTIKELVARKRRMLSTVFAVLLGVSLMAGTLIFTDTMLSAGDNVLEDAHAGIDAMVRAPSDVDLAFGEVGARIDADVIDAVRRRPRRRARRPPDHRLRPARRRRRPRRRRSGAGAGVRVQLDRRRRRSTRSASPRATPRRPTTRSSSTGRSADDGDFHLGDGVTVLTQQTPAAVHDRRHRHLRRRRLAGGRDGRAVHRRRRPALPVDARAGRRDRRQRRRRRLAAGDGRPPRARSVPDLEVVTGATLMAEDQAAFHERARALQGLPARVRFRRRVRRCVHDQQHLLDHRRPAHPADGDAAGARRQPPPGAALGLAEAVAVGVVGAGGRARRRARPGRRSQGAVHRVRPRRCPTARWSSSPASMVISAAVGIADHRGVGLAAGAAGGPGAPDRRPARRSPSIAPVRSNRRAVIGTAVTAVGVRGAARRPRRRRRSSSSASGAVVVFVGVAVLGPVLARPGGRRASALVVCRRGRDG